MCVRNLGQCKTVKGAHILLNLVSLELIDRHCAVEDGDEVDQRAVVFNFAIGGLNIGLQVENIFLHCALGLEETFQSGLAQRQLLQLTLVIPFLVFERNLCSHDSFSAVHGIHHTLEIKELSFYPRVRLLIGVPPHAVGIRDFDLHVPCSRMCQDSLVSIAVCKVINSCIFVFD